MLYTSQLRLWLQSHPSAEESMSQCRSTRPRCLWGSAVCGPERPLNTSGTEQDAGFAQEDCKIYDRGDKTEVEGKTEDSWLRLHTWVQCCAWIIVSAPHGRPNPTLFIRYSRPRWNTQGEVSLALTSMWGHGERLQASAQWVLRSKQAWLLLFFSAPVRSDIKWPKSSARDTADKRFLPLPVTTIISNKEKRLRVWTLFFPNQTFVQTVSSSCSVIRFTSGLSQATVDWEYM